MNQPNVIQECSEQNRLLKAAKATRISQSAMGEVLAALNGYWDDIKAADLRDSTQDQYIRGATYFVRWMQNDFVPGSRQAPYIVKDRKPAPTLEIRKVENQPKEGNSGPRCAACYDPECPDCGGRMRQL
jgi:hypothetical protein